MEEEEEEMPSNLGRNDWRRQLSAVGNQICRKNAYLSSYEEKKLKGFEIKHLKEAISITWC